MNRALAYLCLFPVIATAQTSSIGVRIVCGLTDTSPTKWDGSATARGAQIMRAEPWRFDGDDALSAPNRWVMSTHPIRLFGGGAQTQPRVVANGVILYLDTAQNGAELQVETAQGNFTVKLADIPYGKAQFPLDGKVMVDRIPTPMQITGSPEEQDLPAATVDKTGSVWVAYMEFKHNPEHNRLRANFRTAPTDLAAWNAPTGGDQIFVQRQSGGSWGQPMPVSDPGGDLFHPAIAADGGNRVWVIWPSSQNGNFDLWAREIVNGKPGKTVRLTSEPGSDVFPVAATDAKGRVWVAWQGWRKGRAAIFAAVQQGDSFSAPAAVSTGPGNEWNPAIAADTNGNVSIAWDSYRNGNYDVYMRSASAPGTWGKETAVAASARYEAYPSIAYDPSGRLWVAYEEGAERWGKDFGAYDTAGVALYQGRAIRIRGFERDGRAITTAQDIGFVLPGVPNQKVDKPGQQTEDPQWLEPNPQNAKTRPASRPAVNITAPRNTMPRLHFDSSGRMWVAFRSSHPIWWNPLGTVWTEHVVSFDGVSWTGPIFLSHSDNLLDNRPALVTIRPGELTVIGSSDGRRHLEKGSPQRPNREGMEVADPYNNDLYANTISLAPASGPVRSVAAPAIPAASSDQANAVETKAVQTMRQYRTKDSSLRVVRGEFHRHSDVSMDGGSDGTLIDQWRYALDTASLDWIGCCDHDNGGGREYSWWIEQKLTDVFHTPGAFTPMFSYERSVAYPEGHRNVIFAKRGIRTLPRLPKTVENDKGRAPDTQLLYTYLKKFDGITASHTSGTNMGTDWRDNDPDVEPAVEIYQGDRQNYEMPGAPRSNTADDSIGGWRPKGFVSLALEMGYKLSFQASSDHVSTHLSYCNLYVTDHTRAGILDAFKKRHLYGATDNILADFRSGTHMMGDSFSTDRPPELQVKLVGTAPFAKVQVIRNNQYVYSIDPKSASVDFTWRDNNPERGKVSYYYVRGEQQNGEIVWVSPMWINYTGR